MEAVKYMVMSSLEIAYQGVLLLETNVSRDKFWPDWKEEIREKLIDTLHALEGKN